MKQRTVGRIGNHADFDLRPDNHAFDSGATFGSEGYLDERMGLLIFSQQRRKQRYGGSVGTACFERSLSSFCGNYAKCFLYPINSREDFPRFALEQTTPFCQLNPSANFPIQFYSEKLLQRFHLLEDRRLADVQVQGRLRNIKMPGDRFEDSQLMKSHNHRPSEK
jgi:hypothetical protein